MALYVWLNASLLELDETVDPALSIYVKTVVGTCSEAASKTSISF